MSKTTPWRLLRGGTIRRVERLDRERFVVEVHDAPFAPRVVRLELSGVDVAVAHRLLGHADDLDTTDVAEVARRRPLVGEVRALGEHGIAIDDGARGETRLAYERLTGDETLRSSVREALESWCAQWTGDGLPSVIVALVCAPSWSRADVGALLEAWRIDRTSDLAVAIEVVDGEVRAWQGEPALAELHRLSSSENSTLQACVAAMRGALPDPRLGRRLVRLAARATDVPTVADELLQHLAHHADRGTPDLLDRAASTLRSCPAMAARLRALAAQLRALGPEDRTLPDEVEAALHVRAAV